MARICVVEDEEAIRDIIVEELEDFGHEVRAASNGQDGLELIVGTRPDLIISDINMPRLNGYEMRARLMKEHPEVSKVPFLFLSAFADKSDIADGMMFGVEAYLTKPIDFDLLNRWVRKLT